MADHALTPPDFFHRVGVNSISSMSTGKAEVERMLVFVITVKRLCTPKNWYVTTSVRVL